ncbi:PREDICTED: uncharacterized protein LOC104772931 [Camelina sativa]|uniref:Uncharacterized protein LOC104772931 n=1 Tax=Camelina sativa TaxID=90675 RepID=A0ABM0Y5C3_CAMSA|nr:PREDICTED: uncharacterized protein LOC104772931 [Camelina sativa]
MTNKVWVDDVDTLLFRYNLDNNHWVAIETDLVQRRLRVYDSINSGRTDESLQKKCKPFAKMIPRLIQAYNRRYKDEHIGAAAFSYYRVKTLPQNYQQGDCGVYTLKCLECIALGVNYTGLCDAAMPSIRMKLAADVFDEVPDRDCFLQLDATSETVDYPEAEFNSGSKS